MKHSVATVHSTVGLALLSIATLAGANTCFAPSDGTAVSSDKAVPWNGDRTIKLSLGDWAACDINVQM
jgi:hypothetical protein